MFPSLLLLAFAIASMLPQETKPVTPAGPEVGQPAPRFRLNDHEGRGVTLGGPGKTWTVLAFFPKAATPGWTKEVCSLRDAATDFAKLEVQVYGISRDDVAALAAFAKEQSLSFPLLSDPDGSAAQKYAAGMADRPMTKRLTFVIDDKGILRHVDDKVDVAKHGAALVELIGKLRKQ